MARPLGPISDLGARVANVVDTFCDANDLERASQRRRLTSYSTVSSATPLTISRRVSWGIAVAAVFAIGIGVFWRRGHRDLAFTAGANNGQLQAWLAASEGSSMPLTFSDGSGFQVRPKSRVRVVETASDGARIALERGELHAEVVPRPQGSWWVIAGPYSVHVTGTVFDVRWDPSTERFSVTVSRGGVTVSGPIVGTLRPISAGYRLAVELPALRLEISAINEKGARVAQRDLVRNDVESERDVGKVAVLSDEMAIRADAGTFRAATPSDTQWVGVSNTEPTSPRSPVVSMPEPEWQTLAKAGKLKQAYVAAENQGFSRLCDTASAADLLRLGDAARLAGRPEHAVLALESLRRRFPTDSRRAVAAFTLGKVAFDLRRAFADAAKWFVVSLREQPNGSLSQEASGRLIEALRESGDAIAAARAARDYLERYPEGPHASVARSLLR